MNKTETTVLIIDDDAEIRYSLDRVLAGQGLVVISADSGEKGIETAKAEKPTLIFLDNRMGGISGIETLQHLRTAAPQSLVILMTAYGTTQTAIEAMKHGAFDYVLKPFDLAKLRKPSVTIQHTTCKPRSLLSVLQQPSRYQPVSGSFEHSCSSLPNTLTLGFIFPPNVVVSLILVEAFA